MVEYIELNPDNKMAPPELIEINNVEALLNDVPMEPISVITMSEFRSKLLPIIATASTGEFNVGAWIEEVGHPFVRVKVVDGENVVYDIPALLDQQRTAADENSERIGEHIQELLSIRASSASLANRHMAAALQRTSDPNYDPIVRANEVLSVLNKILSDYNYPSIPLGVAAPSLATVDAPNAVSEDVIVVTGYDPL